MADESRLSHWPHELLDFVRMLGTTAAKNSGTWDPAISRSVMYQALEIYRVRYIPHDRADEFYTIMLAAFTDGEKG